MQGGVNQRQKDEGRRMKGGGESADSSSSFCLHPSTFDSVSLLAIETSTEYLSIAVTNGKDIVAHDCHAGQKHSELILPMIEHVLVEAGIQNKSIHAVAFGAGPGSFTGLRIACG